MEKRKNRVLIEATKCVSLDNDGIKRYGIELLRSLLPHIQNNHSIWEIDVYVGMWFIFNLLYIHDFIFSKRMDSKIPFKLKILMWNIKAKSTIKNVTKKVFPEYILDLLESAKQHFDRVLRSFFKPLDFSKYDLVHLILPHNIGLLARSKCPPLLATVHDLTHLYWPEFHTKDNILNAQKGFDFCIDRKSSFIAISRSTRNDILATYKGVSPKDVYTVYEASDPKQFYPVKDPDELKNVRKKYHIPEKSYFLSLSTLEPRKNLVNTIKAFLLLLETPGIDVVMVVAGKKGWKYETLLKDHTLKSDRVIFTGFVSDQDLAALYSGALALSYVSYYEGFGLPAVEAMRCGTPVIYGNNSSLPEVVGDGGLAADPTDIEDIKEKFKIIAFDDETRGRVARAALRRAKAFSWEKTASETLQVYQDIITVSSKNL